MESKSVKKRHAEQTIDDLLQDEDVLLLTEEQRKALDEVLKGNNVCVCGSAGTGKSYLIRVLVKILRGVGKRVRITASTGIAASNLNLGATTLHSFVGSGLCKESAEREAVKIASNDNTKKQWKYTEVLIIDEISMVRPDFWDKICYIAKVVREQVVPFGGMQVIVFGDWAQLPPVVSKMDKKSVGYKDIKYCFQSVGWKEVIGDNVIILKSVIRQKDPKFVELLRQIRDGDLSEDSKRLILTRVRAKLDCPEGIIPARIMPRKKDVKKHNDQEMEKISEPPFIFLKTEKLINCQSTDSDANLAITKLRESLKKRVDDEVILKKGAVVILTVNLSQDFVNGLQGVVTGFEDGLPIVKFINGYEEKIKKYSWSQKVERKGKDKGYVGVSIEQIPLTPAWAITTHKSQGMTIKFLEIDLSAKNFEVGQAYVALSRAVDLEGLTILCFHENSIKNDPLVVEFYKKYSSNPTLQNRDHKEENSSKISESESNKKQKINFPARNFPFK